MNFKRLFVDCDKSWMDATQSVPELIKLKKLIKVKETEITCSNTFKILYLDVGI